jgi:hypothetical protein
MNTTLAVLGVVLAALTTLDSLHPVRGAGEILLRVVAGGSLLVLAVGAVVYGAFAAALLAAVVALPLLVGPALPWILSRVAPSETNRHGNARPHQT